MKKIILLLAILTIYESCQNKKEYPSLIDKATTYSEQDYNKAHFVEFRTYENITTKNQKLPKIKNVGNKIYPWNTISSKERVEKTMTEIENSIKADSDLVLFDEKTSGDIVFPTLVSNYYTQKQISEYKKTGTITTQKSILNYIEAEVKNYDLVNEKNEKIKLQQEKLGLYIGGFEEKNGNLLEYIRFETLGLNKVYVTLKGFVEIEIKIPTEYEIIEISRNNVGEKYTIGNQEIEILEFDSNVLHYKLFGSDKIDFSDYIVGVNNYTSVQIPESIYEKFRKNQGLDYTGFIRKYKEFGLDTQNNSNEENFVTILYNNDFQIEKVFFYKPTNNGIVKKTIKVPVNITQLQRN